MIGRSQIPYLESPGNLLSWADRIVRYLKGGDANLDGAEVTNAEITADQANYRLEPGLMFRFTTNGSRTIHGFIGGTAARVATIANVGSQSLIIPNQSATAKPENRIITGTGGSVTIAADQTALIQYDSQSRRWRLICAPQLAGGGGPTMPHDLLSTEHPDTSPASPVRGDLIVGNATPLWARFAVGANNTFLGSNGTDPAWTAPGALTKVDDTNVTLTLGGTPTTALLRAASLTLGWTGTLAIARGGIGAGTALGGFNNLSPLTTRGDLLTRDATNNIRLGVGSADRFLGSDGTDPSWVAPGALTKVDDTNVTLTLGGTPTTALLRAASLTLGWTGTLAIARGGIGAGTALGGFNNLSPLTTRGDLLTRDATNNVRLPIGTAGRFVRSDGTDPSWQLLVDADIPSVLSANARVTVRKNSGADVGTRRRLNLIEGSNVTLTVTDDGAGEEVDVTIASAGGVSAHDLLSATHTDTVTNTVTRGSLIAGNVTPAWDELVIGAADTFLGSDGTDPSWTAPGALTKVDDTNVTLTLGGTPTTALLRAASLTLGWTGTLAIARGGTASGTALGAFNNLSPLTTRGDLLTRDATNNVRLAVGAADRFLGSNGTDPSWVAPGALTKTDDTNVTLTLGGTPTTALLRAASLTLGWTGTLAVARGGTGSGTALGGFNNLSPLTTQGDLLTRDASNNIRLAIGTANQVLVTGGVTPTWSKLIAANCGAVTGTTDVFVFATSPTLTDAAPGSGVTALRGLGINLTGTLAGVGYILEILPAGLTVGGGGSPQAALEPIRWDSTITLSSTSAFGPLVMFGGVPHITNSANSILGSFIGMTVRPFFEAADGLTFTVAASNGIIGLHCAPSLQRPGGGTTGTGTLPFVDGLYMAPVITAGWGVTSARAVRVDNASVSGGGTLDFQAAVDIPAALTAATLNCSMRSIGAQFLLHDGNVRLGDTSTNPTKKLEILGANNVTAMTVDLDGTITGTPFCINLLPAGCTIGAGGLLEGMIANGTVTFTGAPNAIGTALFFTDTLIYTNDTNARTLTGMRSFVSQPTFRADTAALTMNNGAFGANAPASGGFTTTPTWSRVGTPTQTCVQWMGFGQIGGTIGAGWTITDFRGFLFRPPTNSGTVTNMYGLDIEAPNGTNNIGARIAATAGDQVLVLHSEATADNPNYIVRQYRAATTDATVTTLGSITIAASNTYLIEARVVARRTGGASGTADDGAVYIRRAMVTTKGGTVTINAVQDGLTQEDQAGWDCTLDVSGATIRIRVTGAASNNVTWHATTTIQNLSS